MKNSMKNLIITTMLFCGITFGQEAVASVEDSSSTTISGEFSTDNQEVVKVPWHFWVGVAAVIAYLGWRLIQGVGLLFW